MKSTYLLLILCFMVQVVHSQDKPSEINYDESKVGAYTLPDPLVMRDGTKVTNAQQWKEKRRDEILNLFKKEMYGVMPPPLKIARVQRQSFDPNALGIKARLIQETIYLEKEGKEVAIDLCIILPPENNKQQSFPAFLACNFFGNHTIIEDPQIQLTRSYAWRKLERGGRATYWDIESIISRGYALVTYSYGDVKPDDENKNGILELFPEYQDQADNLSSIGAWAWGLSRVMDHLENFEAIDAKQVAVMGHSRLGKAALWAGANDERFALVISNNSGSGGASLSRRNYGETLARLNAIHEGAWLCDRFKIYINNEDALPLDQHMLISLMAPRPAYVASAAEDKWADPYGEFLSCVHADPVYRLLTAKGLPSLSYPAVDEPLVGGNIGYHIRSGGHAVTAYDWKQYLDFADSHLKR